MATPPWSTTSMQHLLEEAGRGASRKTLVFQASTKLAAKPFGILKHLLEELQHLLGSLQRLAGELQQLLEAAQHFLVVLQRQTGRLSCRYDAGI
jgi:hypothetical protein